MPRVFLAASVIAAAAIASPYAAQFTAPRSSAVELFLRNLVCEHTTEAGADEVYILLTATSSDGRRISRRLPSDSPHVAAGHWDMNDGNQGCNNASGDSKCIEEKALGTFDTSGGRTWDVTVAFMEEDRGLGKTPEGILAEGIARGNGDLVTTVLATLVGAANNDTDDFLGSVVAHISPGRVDWRRGDRIRNYQPYPNDPNRLQGFSMIGDGANYVAHIGLR
jgi:hypothetical protein